ncbi:MAG: MerR family transcriptional regulator [Calditrichia bacterium]
MAGSSNEIWYRIGEVARQLGIAVETIRMYERSGILLIEKTKTGQRIFNEDDIHWINCIRRLIKEQGLNLEGIRRLLALMPCWDLRPCTKEERDVCPAFDGAIKPCWTMKSEIPESCRADNCRLCNVYQGAIHCENLKKVLYGTNPQKRKMKINTGV